MIMCRNCYGDMFSYKLDDILYVDMCPNCKEDIEKEIRQSYIEYVGDLEYENEELKDGMDELYNEIRVLKNKLSVIRKTLNELKELDIDQDESFKDRCGL